MVPGKQSEALLHDKLSLVRQLPTPAMESVPTAGKPRGFEGQRQAKGHFLSLTPQSRPEKAETVDPVALRVSLEAWYQLLDACDALPPEGGLRGLIAKRAVRADLVAAIDTAHRKLSLIARQGGRGFAPQKAVSP